MRVTQRSFKAEPKGGAIQLIGQDRLRVIEILDRPPFIGGSRSLPKNCDRVSGSARISDLKIRDTSVQDTDRLYSGLNEAQGSREEVHTHG